MASEQALVRLRELIPELPEQLPNEGGSIAVEVEITGTTAQVRFVSQRGTDERTIEAQTCKTLAEAVVLAVAVAVEAEAQADMPEQPPMEPADGQLEAAPEQQPETAPEQQSELLLVEPPTAKHRVRGHVAVLAGGGYGPMDTGMGTVALEFGVHGQWWRMAVRGFWVPPRLVPAGDPGAFGRYDGWLGGARACVVPPLARGRLELPVCTGLEGGVLRGRGLGTTPNPHIATQPWAAVELGPGLLYVANRWVSLGLELDLVVGLLRGGFTIGDVVVQSRAPVGVRALARLEVRFP